MSLRLHVLALVDAATGRAVRIRRDDRRALGAVGVAGELLVAAVDVPPLEEQLGAVGEGVFDRVGVEVLVDVVAAVAAGARALGRDRPGVLHPAALVDVVDQEVAEAAAAGPEEPVEPLDLVQQLADAVGLGAGQGRADRPGLAVGPQHDDVADLAVLDPVEAAPAAPRSGGTSGRRPP